MIPAFLATGLFCVSAVTATRTARLLGGTEANFWRLVVAALMLAVYAHLLGMGLTGSALPTLVLSGLVGFGIGDVALFQALPRLGSRLTILLVHCLSAPFAAACEWIWLDTRLTPAEIICAATILGGVSIGLVSKENVHVEKKHLVPGILFTCLAAFGQGFGAVLSRYAFLVAAVAGDQLDGITAAYQRIFAGVIFGGICLLVVKRDYIFGTGEAYAPQSSSMAGLIADKWRRVWYWVLINAAAGPALGVSFYQWALKSAPAGVVLPIVSITPLAIIPLSMWFERERPGPKSLLGGIIAVAGAVSLAWVHANS